MPLEKEAAFTDLALRAAAGEISSNELDHRREHLMDALCTAVYEKSFPKPYKDREQA